MYNTSACINIGATAENVDNQKLKCCRKLWQLSWNLKVESKNVLKTTTRENI